MLIINLNSIKNDRESFIKELPGELFNPVDEIFFNDPVLIDCHIYRTGEQVIIEGEACTKASLVCSRCLEEYRYDLKAKLFFITIEELEEMDQESEESIEADPCVIVCNTAQLDLLPEIKGALLLALPMKPLCKESCLGICSNCGVIQKKEKCQCSKHNGENPFANLKNWPDIKNKN